MWLPRTPLTCTTSAYNTILIRIMTIILALSQTVPKIKQARMHVPCGTADNTPAYCSSISKGLVPESAAGRWDGPPDECPAEHCTEGTSHTKVRRSYTSPSEMRRKTCKLCMLEDRASSGIRSWHCTLRHQMYARGNCSCAYYACSASGIHTLHRPPSRKLVRAGRHHCTAPPPVNCKPVVLPKRPRAKLCNEHAIHGPVSARQEHRQWMATWCLWSADLTQGQRG